MKSSFLLMVLLLSSMSMFGERVDSLKALRAGQAFFSGRPENIGQPAPVVHIAKDAVGLLKSAKAEGYCYVVNNENGGFVIIAGSDKVTPVLGYSDSGFFDAGNVPPALVEMLAWREREIAAVETAGLTSTSANASEEWAQLLSPVYAPSATTAAVTPLLSTLWGQGTYFNAKCPYDNTAGTNVLTGCVATTMAQIMKYWEYPVTGTGAKSYIDNLYGTQSAGFGITTYNWTAMPNVVSSASDALATLMYHCGVSVEMDYGVDGSSAVANGSLGPSAQHALRSYFGYKSSISGIDESKYTQIGWSNAIKTELNAGRPVIYSGWNSDSSVGHTFICDGYDADGYFHFNWGWSGSFDGYYPVASLVVDGSDFSYSQKAIIGIEPGTVSLAVSPTAIAFNSSANSTTFRIVTNSGSSWSISGLPAWLTLSTSSGTGCATVTLTVSQNTTAIDRTATLSISVTGLSSAKNISVSQLSSIAVLPNLTLYNPSGWDDKIVLSNLSGTTKNDILTVNDNVYVDFSIINTGSADVAGTFHTMVLLDGENTANYYTSGLSAGYSALVKDLDMGKLALGNHTLSVSVDYLAEALESSETDNVYTRSFTVYAAGFAVSPSVLKLASPLGSSANAVVTANTTWSITGVPAWLSVGATSGNGNVSMAVSAITANNTMTARTAVLTFTDANLNKATLTVTQNALTATGFDDEVATAVTVSPNPFTGRLTVASPTKINGIVLLDAAGRVVFQQTGDGFGGDLDLSFLPGGLYLMQVKTEGSVLVRRVIKK